MSKDLTKYEKSSIKLTRWGLFLTVIGILVGVFIGYLQISISRSLKPDLHGRIIGLWDGDIPSGGHGLIFSATISNLGSPSIVEDYSLEVKLAGDIKVATYTPHVLPDKIKGQIPATFNVGDASALFDKTVHPIGSGDQAVGWLFFVFPNITGEQLHAPGTRLVLIFKDVTGKTYRSEERFFTGKDDGSLNYLPGAGKPFDIGKKQ